MLQAAVARLSSLPGGRGHRVDGSPAEQPPVVAGTLGDFRIVRELGRGGMGIVYEAEQLSLGRRVALKILPSAALLDPRQLQRFQNEARAAASLEHPNIVSVYGIGVERSVHYYVMRCIDGKNLYQFLEQLRERWQQSVASISPTKPICSDPTPIGGSGLTDLLATPSPLDAAYLRSVARIGVQAAEALDYAHEHGVVHRDIKPSNLMLDQTGRLWVADFGLARIETDPTLSMSGGILGTLRYMSPEQALGKRGVVDHRSDVYSLGVTLYELLTLTPIFPDADRGTLLSRIATHEPKPPRQLNPRIPADLETIVLKAMAKNAADRYETAGALAADLKRFLESRPILARPLGRAKRALKWARRRPAVAALVAISTLAVLALLAGGWWHAATLQSALTATERMRMEADSQRIEADAQRQAAEEQKATAQQREHRVRQYLYAGDMRQAYAAWTNSHVGETLDLLERHRPKPGEDDRRSFVWYYLWKLCHGELLTLRGHGGDVHCVAFSPDGRWLATASQDHTAKLWDATTGKELVTYKGHTDEVNTVAFSPDGKTLATCSDDHTVRLWDTQSGRERATLRGHTRDVFTVAFSPDGKILASGGPDPVVKLWEASSGKESATLVGPGTKGGIEALAFSPDGTTLATGGGLGNHNVILWDLATKRRRTVVSGYDNAVLGLAFAHDGRLLATSIDRLAPIRLVDTVSGVTKATLQAHTEQPIHCVAFSADDKIVAGAGRDGTVYLWDAQTGQLRRSIRGHASRIWYVAFSPDGQTLATASGDRTVKLWKTGESQATRFALNRYILSRSFATAENGKILAYATEMKHNGKPVPPEIWEIGETLTRRPLEAFLRQRMSGGVTRVEFAPGGKMLALADDSGRFRIYDTSTWSLRTTFSLSTAEPDIPDSVTVLGIGWSPDGRSLATANKNEPRIKLWDTATGQLRTVLRRNLADVPFRTVTFSPDGTTVAAGDGVGVLILWSLQTGSERATPRLHQVGIEGLAFSHDGQTVATASGDRTIRIWDVATLHERATLQGHGSAVLCVAFSPDGRTLASGGTDGTVRLWDTDTWQELVVLEAHKAEVRSVAFTHDGQTLVTCGTSFTAPRGPYTSEVAVWSAPHEQADRLSQ